MTTWSLQQQEALAKAVTWLRIKWAPWFYLAGYAGSGKTTLAKHIAEQARGEVAYAAFTGKAASVMRSKGCKGASTIHALIYDVAADPVTGKLVSTRKPTIGEYALIVVDEVSMVDEVVGNDLLSYGIPILVLGDPAQLPPINGAGFFTSRDPDYLLTEVHRQAADSAILRLATEIREGRFVPTAWRGAGLTICTKRELEPDWVLGADMVIVGRNDTRMKYNSRIRQLKGIASAMPAPAEPVICLENSREVGIFNGEIYVTRKITRRGRMLSMTIHDPERDRNPFLVKVRREFFENDVEAAKLPFKDLADTQRFTYGYAITCHKSQGSQWPKVCVFDESGVFHRDARRWLCTAVTRASEHLTLVI